MKLNNRHHKLTLYITSLFISLLVLLTALFIGVGWLKTQKANRFSPDVIYQHISTSDENLTILYMSCREEGDVATSYQIIHYNAPTSKIYTFALPSELVCTVSSKTDTLYNQYDYQSVQGAILAVENVTGIKIDRYIRTSNDGISGLLYNIGAIPCDIPASIAEKDLGLSQGIQTLDGFAVTEFISNPNLDPIDKLTMQNEFFFSSINKIFYSSDFNATKTSSTPQQDDTEVTLDNSTTSPYGKAEQDKLKIFYEALFKYTETNITQLDIQFRERGIEKLFLDDESAQIIDLTFEYDTPTQNQNEIEDDTLIVDENVSSTTTLSPTDKTIIKSFIEIGD